MKKFITALCLTIYIHGASGQNESVIDNYFKKTEFNHAKINNDDASLFFTHFQYNSGLDGKDGNVFVSFIVKKDGLLDSVKVLNDPDQTYVDAVLKAFKESEGHWNASNFDSIMFDKKYIAAFNFTNASTFFTDKDKSVKYLKKGQTDKAMRFITQALKINPFDSDLYLYRARIFRKQGKYDLEMLDLALIDRLNSDVLFNIWFKPN